VENTTDKQEGEKMMKNNAMGGKVAVTLFGAMMVMAVLVTGCSTLKPQDGETSAGRTAPVRQGASNAPVYYDFGDVMLPRELKVDTGNSFVMKSAGMTSGVLVLKGGVDSASLINFFETKMPGDGWTKKGSFRSSRSIMLFEKKNRWCVIAIVDGRMSTQVDIWVAPTEDGL
jgi:hypothetical protein